MAMIPRAMEDKSVAVSFSLIEFEKNVYSGNVKNAFENLKQFMILTEVSYGGLHGAQIDQYMVARLTAAMTALFANPKLELYFRDFSSLMLHYQWFTVLFGVSQFRTADHVIQSLANIGPEMQLDIPPKAMMKAMLLWSMDSMLDFECDSLWRTNDSIACTLFMAQMGCRMAISKKAFEQKNRVLDFLADKLTNTVLGNISFGNQTDVMMHVDYATAPNRYIVKQKIANYIHDTFINGRVPYWRREGDIPTSEKPRLVIVFDWYHKYHVVHRALHAVIRKLRERFHVTGLIITDEVVGTAEVGEVVDKVVRLESQDMGMRIDEATKRIKKEEPDAIFYPGIGLSQFGTILANIRLAKVQITSHGHPSSSCSKVIDYFLVEEGYREATRDFTEKVIYVSNRSFPQTKQYKDVHSWTETKVPQDRINVAISLSLMKINPMCMGAFKRIQDANPKILFHIMVGVSFGISRDYAEHHIKQYLPGAVVYGHQPLPDYNRLVAACDMFLVPFPFGNSNAMLDCIAQGLPGVCMDGDRIYSHMAAFYMQWLSHQNLRIVTTENKYVAEALTMAEEIKEHGRSMRLDHGMIESVYHGTPEVVVDVMERLVRGTYVE